MLAVCVVADPLIELGLLVAEAVLYAHLSDRVVFQVLQ
jgi:hypothetical protein